MTAVPAVSETTASLQKRLANNKVDPTSTGDGKQFLRYDAKRTGEWDYGREREPCTGDVIAVDVTSLQHGWHLWHKQKVTKRMAPVWNEIPTPPDDVEYEVSGKIKVDSPNEARYLEGNFEDGTRVVLEGATFGMRKAVDLILGQVFQRAGDGNPLMWPHVRLATDSYIHKEYSEVYEPVLEVVAWYDENGNTESAKLDAPKAEPENAAEDDEPAPTRRRRRSGK